MCCNSSPYIPFLKALYYAHGKGRPLYRVSAGSQLVKKHKRVVRYVFKYIYSVFHMGRKRTQILLYALLITYIGKYFVKYPKLRIIKGRYMKPRLAHKLKKPEGFKRNSFSSSVWACYKKRCEFAAQIYIYRHNSFSV